MSVSLDMKNIKHILTIVVLASSTLFATHEGRAQNKTPDYWQCSNRVGGEWNFGRAPSACRVSPFQNENDVSKYWDAITFKDSATRSSERVRYMSEMNSFILNMGVSYLKKRKPNVSKDEQTAWLNALLPLVNQESFWTHYRKANSTGMHMMRGDFGHGHGLMQVDDRWHFVKVKEGGAARIEENILYAFDIMYDAWERAAKASCVSSPSNYLARTRAMYSVYNGGNTKVCRWTNTNDRWYKNDKNYWDKYNAKAWVKYIDGRKPTAFNYSCLVQNGGLKCFDPSIPNPDPNPEDPDVDVGAGELSKAEIYLVGTNYQCTWNGSFLSCLPYSMGENGLQCLKDLFGIDQAVQPTDLATITSKPVEVKHINPSTKCTSTSLANIGSFVETQVAINLRKTPGGDKIGVLSKGHTFQVLDNYVNTTSKIRYYLVTDGKITGYAHGGTNEDASYYFKQTTRKTNVQYVANIGDRIVIKNSVGINQRKTAGGTLIQLIPRNERLDVIGRVIQGDDKDVYYKVKFRGQEGYIYSGRLAPSPTSMAWTGVE